VIRQDVFGSNLAVGTGAKRSLLTDFCTWPESAVFCLSPRAAPDPLQALIRF